MSAHDWRLTRRENILARQHPTELRRCLACDHWMRSSGCDHRICNACKAVQRADRVGAHQHMGARL